MARLVVLVCAAVFGVLLSCRALATQVPPCDDPINQGALFCNPSASLTARLDDLLRRIPLNETPALFGSSAAGSSSIGMPPYQWWSEGLHGVASSPGVTFGGSFPAATSFPQVCTSAASFNTTLFSAIGDVVGREGRAMNNHGRAGLTFWAPNINIYRDPRWGRGQETPGEDPLLTSRYAMHFVRGMQNNSMDPSHLRVSSCCKHYLAYDMEDSDGYTRFDFDAQVSEYDLENTYLVAFQSCIHVDGGAASGIMCSYNAENGVPSCANKPYLTDLARGTWGFDGYVTSDCGAVGCVLNEHHYTTTWPQTLNVTLGAGMDLDCGGSVSWELLNAVSSGALSESAVYTALRHQFSVLMRLGYFDPNATQPFKTLGPSDVNTEAAQQIALEAAEQGIVLLNYNVSYLPWDASSIRSVAVMGNNANYSAVLQGNYYGVAPFLITPLEGIQQVAGPEVNVTFLDVLNAPSDMSTKHYDEACRMAKENDATLLVIGNDQTIESEGNDRTSIAFPGNQVYFVRYIAACAQSVSKQITVVAMSGGSLDYNPIKDDPGVGGIFWAGYPGQAGGLALARLIYGLVSPSGRLPTTIYPASFVNDVAMTNMQMEANETTASPGFTYRYYTGTPVYPFGWGLTYTNWTLVVVNMSLPSDPSEILDARDDVKLRGKIATEFVLGSFVVNITNTGSRASAFTLLSKVTPLNPGPDIGGTLSDFVKVFLNPQQSKLVTLNVNAHSVFGSRLSSNRVQQYRVTVNDELHVGIFP